MATANELLAMAADSGVDKTLIIDNDLRTIIIPKSVTNLGTEFDKDVHRLQFQMPRFFNDIDLSELNIRINYMNANNEGDIYAVTDKKILSSTITFSWLVGAHALIYKGDVNFIVCLKKSDIAGNVLKEFNTTPASLPVLEGLEVDTAALEYPMMDILEQLLSLTDSKLSEVESAGAEQIAKVSAKSAEEQENIANKGAEVLATIPEDYQTTYKLANEGVRTKANAIVCNAIGEVISVSDSSDDSLRGLNIFGKSTQVKTTGKNLLELTVADRDVSGATLKVNADKSLTINGTVSTNTSVVLGKFRHSGEFVMSAGVSFDAMNASYFYMTLTDNTNIGWYGKEVPFNHDGTERSLILVVIAGKYSNLTFYPMIRYSSIADSTYEPYTGGIPAPNPDYPQEIVSVENPTVEIYGKNIANPDAMLRDDFMTKYGNVYTLTKGERRFSGTQNCYIPANTPLCISAELIEYTGVSDFWIGVNLSFEDGTGGTVGLYVDSSAQHSVRTYSKPIVKIGLFMSPSEENGAITKFKNLQIEVGSTPTNYEPYKEKRPHIINHTLPAIPVASGGNYTDSDGQQWICDEIDFERGVYVKRITERVMKGTEHCILNAKALEQNINVYQYYTENVKPVANVFYCSHFMNAGPWDTNLSNGKNVAWHTRSVLMFKTDGIQTLDDFTAFVIDQHAAGTPITVKFAMETPIETPLTADEIAAFQALRSNYPNTTVLNDSGATMKLKYNADTETWIKNLIDERIATAIASIQ